MRLIWVVVLAACGSKFEPGEASDDPHPHPMEFRGTVPEATLIAGDKEIAKLEAGATSINVGPFKPSEWLAMRDRLKARYNTTCGPSTVNVLRVDLTTFRLELPQEPIEATVHVDNEGQPAGKVELGRTTHALPANEMLEVKVSVGSCPEARTVKVDGKELATLAPRADKHRFESHLVDVTGKHCYVLHEVIYTDAAHKDKVKPKDVQVFEGKHVHEVFAAFWLKDPPARMTDFANTGRETFKRVIRCEK
jgi:hypothetical protein